MSFNEIMNVPAKESALFWSFIGLIVAVILVFSLREFFSWYFRISELREEIAKLSGRLDAMSGQGLQLKPAAEMITHHVDDAEIAAVIAAVKNRVN
jgi:hypothetical protein